MRSHLKYLTGADITSQVSPPYIYMKENITPITMNWTEIKSESDLPPEGKYVIAKHNRGNWHDKDDQENVNTVIVKLIRGISKNQRQEDFVQGKITALRYNTYKKGDEHGNNSVPWSWDSFGPDSFFGQSITHWMSIPPVT